MALTVVVVDVQENQTQAHFVDGWNYLHPANKEHFSLVFHPGDVVPVAQQMAKRNPGRDVLVLEIQEAFFAKASPVIRKIYNRETKELVVS